jgi:hypothetical protein
MSEEIPLKEKVDNLYKALNLENTQDAKNLKVKVLKMPKKSKVRKAKIKKGWVGVIKISENGNISGEKVKVEDSAFKLKDGTYHATNGQEILMWEGKFPVIVQETKKLNPVRFNQGENETYGQKYVLATMLKDAIKVKGKGGGFIIWIIVAAALFFGAKYIFKF